MNIYVQIMTIYVITMAVSMFVALVIWCMAKVVNSMPEEGFSFAFIREDIKRRNERRRQFLRDFNATTVKGSEDLINYHHEHA